MAATVFEGVHCAEQIILDHLAARSRAVNAPQNARVGGRFNDRIYRWKNIEIGSAANIAVIKSNTEPRESGTIDFTSGPRKVIEPNKFVLTTLEPYG